MFPVVFGSDLKAAIVFSLCRLSTESPEMFPLGVSEFRAHYLSGHTLKPSEAGPFKKRFSNAIRALEKQQLIKTSKQPDPNHPQRIPKKYIHVWRR